MTDVIDNTRLWRFVAVLSIVLAAAALGCLIWLWIVFAALNDSLVHLAASMGLAATSTTNWGNVLPLFGGGVVIGIALPLWFALWAWRRGSSKAAAG